MSDAKRPRIRTLLIDDSAFARKIVREILATSPAIEVVGAARDGEDGLKLAQDLVPDIIVCDLSMPNLDGVGFVRKQMAARPVPILILSAAAENASEVIDALAAGAVDVLRKPTALATDDLRKIGRNLIETIESIAGNPGHRFLPEAPPVAVAPPAPAVRGLRSFDLVAIGISTGGPQALRQMIPRFPPEFPVPIAIVLHMPVGYTALYAEKLNEMCRIKVKEAQEGDELRPGQALVAAAGRHLCVRRGAGGRVFAELRVQPLEKPHRPSVDVLFRTAADVYRERVLGIVMTGMGDDGREGAAWIKAHGGRIFTQSEKSCIIYGMPRSVDEAGLSDASYSLEQMADAIIQKI